MTPINWRAHVRRRLPPTAAAAEREIEIVDELANQLEATYERERRGGASHDAAMAAADAEVPDWAALARTLTAVTPARHSPPGGTQGGFMNGIAGDLRHAARSLRGAPAFTFVAIITLSLGLGLAAAAFAVVDTVLIRPLPFPASDRLVLVHATVPPAGTDTPEITYPDAADLAKETRAFESMGIVMTFAGTATALDPPERIEGYDVSVTLFDTLGVQPMLGRGFTAAEGEPGKDTVVILGYGFWQRLGGRTDIIGQTLMLDDVPKTIIGVMPRDFRIEVLNNPGAIFRPVTRDHFAARSRAFRAFRAIGRLPGTATLAEANSVAAIVGERLARDYPDTNLGRAFSLRLLQDDVVGTSRAGLLMVAGLVAVVLLIAGVNLANLLLARSVARASEMAVRGALGASGWRLARGPIVEGLVLAGTGAVLGTVVAQAIISAIKSQPGVALPRLAELTVNWSVLATIGVGAILAAALVGLVPFLLYRHGDHNPTLRASRGTAGTVTARMRSLLVVGQTALAFILLTATVLLALSLQRVLALPIGFDTSVATMRVSIPATRYPTLATVTRFYSEFLDELRQQPGIQSAGFVSTLPLSGNAGSSLTIQGREDIPVAQRPGIGWQWADPSYFEAMGIPLIRGRGFTNADLQNPAHVTVINETLARQNFPGEDPIGRRVYFGPIPSSGVPEWHQIIGVVGDVRHRSLEGEPDARAYDLFGQHWGRTISLVARTTQPPAQVATTVRGLLARRDSTLPVFAVRTTGELVSTAVRSRRLMLWLVAAFGLVGFAVATLGVYGIVACLVAERQREIGVRVALGATAANIHQLVVVHGIKLVATGLVAGLVGAVALRRGIESQLFNVSSTNVPALTAVALALLIAAAIPCVIVSRRASRIDPVKALRSE
jgi:putative ABC transport system permease protein